MNLQKALEPFFQNFEIQLILSDPETYLDFAEQVTCLNPYPLHRARRKQVEAAVERRLSALSSQHPAYRQVAAHYQLSEWELIMVRLKIEFQSCLFRLSLRPAFTSFLDHANTCIQARKKHP